MEVETHMALRLCLLNLLVVLFGHAYHLCEGFCFQVAVGELLFEGLEVRLCWKDRVVEMLPELLLKGSLSEIQPGANIATVSSWARATASYLTFVSAWTLASFHALTTLASSRL